MSRLIDADALLEVVRQYEIKSKTYYVILDLITNAPTVQREHKYCGRKIELVYGSTNCGSDFHGSIMKCDDCATETTVQRELVIDCRTCANRGVVNGSSQETFCEHCIHGTSWKRNYYEPLPAAPKEEIKMAMSDYRLCDVCGKKAFYDAELQYDFKKHPETGLFNLGAWECLCIECAKTHEVVIKVKE